MNFRYIGGEKRKIALKKAMAFMANPGMFCFVITGNRGVGKKFMIEKCFLEYLEFNTLEDCEELRLQGYIIVTDLNSPTSEKELDALFLKNLNRTIIFEKFENYSVETQKVIFNALSTTNGKFGISKKVNVRVGFLTSRTIGELRNGVNNLLPLLWDRISQLIIEVPSLGEVGENIWEAFESSWIKMKFKQIKAYEELAEMPKIESLKHFLEKRRKEFVGGFRDLDKLASLYFNYRILIYEQNFKITTDKENRVFNSVVADFIGKTQMAKSDDNTPYLFDFNNIPGVEQGKIPELEYILLQFKMQLRKWLEEDKKISMKNAAEQLKCSVHTLKKYKLKTQ
jgi:hypothetical protein